MANMTLANTTLPAATVNMTTLNSTTTCTLSPHARALSSVLTGFVGTMLTGVSSGFMVAFMVAWVCWFASFRVVLIGVYQVYSVCRLELPAGGQHFFEFLDRLYHHDLRVWSDGFFRGAVDESVTFLGWLGWMYTTLYSPVIQVMWLVENWNKASTGLKLARAIAVCVAALPSTFDTRARYGRALGGICGWPAAWMFAVLTASSTMVLAGVSVIELGLVAKGLTASAWTAGIYITGYVIFTLIWTYGSLVFASPHDDAKSLNGWAGRLSGLGMGVFGGCFVAAPAFAVMMAAEKHPGVGLSAYLRCEGTAWWQKMVAILP